MTVLVKASGHDGSPERHEDDAPRPSRVSGTVLAGRYRLDRLLGIGGMGEVWAATHTVTQRPAALKLLRPELGHDEHHRRRFLREARVAGAIRHPNVIPILDVIELEDGVPMMVMDLLEGESLRERLDRSKSLGMVETARVLLPVVSAVATAHEQGVVHRDLKPENIFLARVDGESRVVVLDFGIAKVTPLEGGGTGSGALTGMLTARGTMMGTPYYMSPEQIYGEPDVDGRCDVWALGVILYECLTGRRPTEAEGLGQILKIITQSGIVPIDEVRPDLPSSLSSLIMGALSPRREDRPALEPLYAALRAHCDEAPPLPESRAARSTRSSRRAVWAATLAMLVVAVVSLAVWSWVRQGEQAARQGPPSASIVPAAPTAPLLLAEPARPAPSAPDVAPPAASAPSPSPPPAAAPHSPIAKPVARPSRAPRAPAPATAPTASGSWLDQR